MPKRKATPDKRSKSDLDLFILALLEAGITTAYGLRIYAGLSPGATLPVLARLKSKRLAKPADAASRGRTDFHPTAAGINYLKSGWRSLLEADIPPSADAVLRTVALTVVIGGDSRAARAYLARAAKARRAVLEAGPATGGAEISPKHPLPQAFLRMRSAYEAARLKAEAQVFAALAKNLGRKGR